MEYLILLCMLESDTWLGWVTHHIWFWNMFIDLFEPIATAYYYKRP